MSKNKSSTPKRAREASPELFGETSSTPKRRRTKQEENGNQTESQDCTEIDLSNRKEQAKSPLFQLSDTLLQHIFQYLSMDDVVMRVILVCKEFYEKAFQSFRDIRFFEEASQFKSTAHMITLVSKLKKLESLSFDGYEELNDKVLQKILKKVSPHLKVLHIRQCDIINPVIESDTLETLRISLCAGLNKLTAAASALKKLELYDCEIKEAPRLDTPNLETLKFFSCTSLTDKKLVQIMRQFDDHSVLFAGTAEKSPVPKKINTNLKRLFITECEPLSNPLVQCESLEELRIINCRTLSNPFIRCLSLKNLQLNWCENLENLVLGCDNLKTIDLTGAGMNVYRSQSAGSVRDTIITALRNHFSDQLTITY